MVVSGGYFRPPIQKTCVVYYEYDRLHYLTALLATPQTPGMIGVFMSRDFNLLIHAADSIDSVEVGAGIVMHVLMFR